jgi:hypothetical protein
LKKQEKEAKENLENGKEKLKDLKRFACYLQYTNLYFCWSHAVGIIRANDDCTLTVLLFIQGY